MRYFIIYILVLVISGCSATQGLITNSEAFFKVSKREFKKERCGIYIDNFYQNKIEIIDKFGFINFETDTVFLLQKYNIQTGEFNESVWDTKSTLEYSKVRNKIDVVEKPLFPKYYYTLIENWDLDSIMSYEKKYGGDFGSNKIVAYKIVLKNGEIDTECITFDSFFSPELESK